MREKESLRTLCESLRRERDRAESDYREAVTTSEEIKRQKNLASMGVELATPILVEIQHTD